MDPCSYMDEPDCPTGATLQSFSSSKGLIEECYSDITEEGCAHRCGPLKMVKFEQGDGEDQRSICVCLNEKTGGKAIEVCNVANEMENASFYVWIQDNSPGACQTSTPTDCYDDDCFATNAAAGTGACTGEPWQHVAESGAGWGWTCAEIASRGWCNLQGRKQACPVSCNYCHGTDRDDYWKPQPDEEEGEEDEEENVPVEWTVTRSYLDKPRRKVNKFEGFANDEFHLECRYSRFCERRGLGSTAYWLVNQDGEAIKRSGYHCCSQKTMDGWTIEAESRVLSDQDHISASYMIDEVFQFSSMVGIFAIIGLFSLLSSIFRAFCSEKKYEEIQDEVI